MAPFPSAEPDAEILLHLLATGEGGRRGPIASGYRGQHLIAENWLTSSEIELLDRELLQPGEHAVVHVRYLSPEHYPATLWVGKQMPVQEGSRVVGSATVRRVFNRTLQGRAPHAG